MASKGSWDRFGERSLFSSGGSGADGDHVILAEKGELTVIDVGEAARFGDYEALKIVHKMGRLVEDVRATLVSVLDPPLIVIGEGVSRIGHSFLAEVHGAVYGRLPPLAKQNLPTVPSELENDGGVVGASVLAAEGIPSTFAVQT